MAAGWYCRAAEKGNAAAQVTLGMICLSGQSVDRDTEKAAQSFKSTAEQGDARAIQSGAAHSRRRRGAAQRCIKALLHGVRWPIRLRWQLWRRAAGWKYPHH
jgi:TPR repeat protein